MIKILFIGDIVGKIGRQAAQKALPALRKKYEPDFIIANGENLAHGLGITVKTMRSMLEAGVDFFTSGNHIFDKKEETFKIFKDKELSEKLLRPANYRTKKSGEGAKIISSGKYKLLVINLCGQVFIRGDFTSPFKKFDKIYKDFEKKKFDAVFVDFHAETTSEKLALAHFIKDRVSVMVGTHTHIQTSDEQLLNGMAYITDVGMTGPKDSIIGEKIESIIKYYVKDLRHKYDIVEEGKAILNGIYIEIDSKTKKALKIKRINQEV